jgi:DtxR family transcriptional regulator, Mn-dependent transcriptional regulator
MVTRAVEDYLKAIYKLQQEGAPASTNAIADSMGLQAASVTAMLQQLSKQGLADYTRYQGVSLTVKGKEAALRVIRRHRLIELYLHQRLGVPWDRLHDEAERLEHVISPYLEERIDAALGHPQFDPHGDPIPTSAGALPVQDLVPLSDLPLDTPSVVRRISDHNPDLLRYVDSLGLVPDATVKVTQRAPFGGPLYLDVISPIDHTATPREQVIGAEIARNIFVTRPQETRFDCL